MSTPIQRILFGNAYLFGKTYLPKRIFQNVSSKTYLPKRIFQNVSSWRISTLRCLSLSKRSIRQRFRSKIYWCNKYIATMSIYLLCLSRGLPGFWYSQIL